MCHSYRVVSKFAKDTQKEMIRSARPVNVKKSKTSSETTLCKYSNYTCSSNSLEGYEHCVKHILEDKNAPYKQCNYIYTSNGKRCTAAAPKADKRDGFCAGHAWKAQLLRQRATRKRKPHQTPETLLSDLNHYAQDADSKGKELILRGSGDEPNNQTSTSQPLNPFVDIDAQKVNSSASKILDYASDSDSDAETSVLDSAWRGDVESEAESIDSDMEDPLKHAGTYTADEVALITRDKLIRLQSLYIEQFKRLQHVLREKRRKYLQGMKKEKETMISIHKQPKTTPEEQKLYEKLKALNHYHRKSGIEAVLHKKTLDRRLQTSDGSTPKPPPTARCIFTEGGVKCGERTLPLTRYCMKHILEDTHQVLYSPCGCSKADTQCREPIANMFQDLSCTYHVSLSSLPHVKCQKTEETTPDQNNLSGLESSDNKAAIVSHPPGGSETSLLQGNSSVTANGMGNEHLPAKGEMEQSSSKVRGQQTSQSENNGGSALDNVEMSDLTQMNGVFGDKPTVQGGGLGDAFSVSGDGS